MLKLEKATSSAHVSIRMREKERFFHPPLIKALVIALALHFSALILFHVTPFSFTSDFLFPPVHVQADQLNVEVSSVVPSILDEEALPPALSLIPPFDWNSLLPALAPPSSLNFDLEALQELEQKEWPKWETPISLLIEEPWIQLYPSGDLADLKIIKSDPLLSLMQPLSSRDLAKRIAYQVEIDGITGKIFWYDRLESSEVAAIDQLTQKILLNLQFETSSDNLPVSGILNFVVLDKKND